MIIIVMSKNSRSKYVDILESFHNPPAEEKSNSEETLQDKKKLLGLSKQQIYEFEIAFNMISNNNDTIRADQVNDLIRSMGYTFQESDLEELLNHAGQDNEGNYSFDVLSEAFDSWMQEQLNIDELSAIFRSFVVAGELPDISEMELSERFDEEVEVNSILEPDKFPIKHLNQPLVPADTFISPIPAFSMALQRIQESLDDDQGIAGVGNIEDSRDKINFFAPGVSPQVPTAENSNKSEDLATKGLEIDPELGLHIFAVPQQSPRRSPWKNRGQSMQDAIEIAREISTDPEGLSRVGFDDFLRIFRPS